MKPIYFVIFAGILLVAVTFSVAALEGARHVEAPATATAQTLATR